MADEKKKKEQEKDLPEGYEKTKLGSYQETVKAPTTSTTTKGDQVTTRTEQTVSGIYNPDGTLNEQAIGNFNTTQRDPLAKAYGIDPNTGEYNGNVADLLGFDPKIREAEQRKKEELARFKQKEAGWKNALGVITDIASASAGGNVWKREPDGVAAKAKAEGDAAGATIQAIGEAIPAAKRAREREYEAAVQKRLAQYAKDMSYKVSQSHTQGGNSQTVTTGGGTRTVGSRDAVVGRGTSGSGSGNGSSGQTSFVVTINDDPNNAKHNEYTLTKEQYKNVLGVLTYRYNKLLNDPVNGERYRRAFIESGVLKQKGTGLNATFEFDDDQIMRGGRFWGLEQEDVRKINEYIENKLSFTNPQAQNAPTFGSVETEVEYDD